MASEAISQRTRIDCRQSAQRRALPPKSYFASAEQCAQNLLEPVMPMPRDQQSVTISPALAAMLRNTAVFLESQRKDAPRLNSNLNCAHPQIPPNFRHTSDMNAESSPRISDEGSFPRAPSACQKKRRGNGETDQGTVEASCADSLATSSKAGQEFGRHIGRARFFSRQDRRPPLRWNPVALPPFGDHAGGCPNLGCEREACAVRVLRTPQFYD